MVLSGVVQFLDKVVDVPVAVHVWMVNTVEVPQLQFIDKVVVGRRGFPCTISSYSCVDMSMTCLANLRQKQQPQPQPQQPQQQQQHSVAILAQDCHKTSCFVSTMADRCERFFLFSYESERSDGSSGDPEWKYIAPAPAVYAVPAPAVDLAPAPAVYAVPAPVVEYSAPAPAVPVVEYSAPAPAVPVVEYIAPAPAVPVVEYIALAPAAPVVEYIAPAPAVPVVDYIAPAPAIYAAPAPVVEDIVTTLVSLPTPVVEYIASVPTSTQQVFNLVKVRIEFPRKFPP